MIPIVRASSSCCTLVRLYGLDTHFPAPSGFSYENRLAPAISMSLA